MDNNYKQLIDGYFSALYFKKTKIISKKFASNEVVTCQFFQRENNVILCGMNQVIKFLKKAFKNKNIKVWSLQDGDIINNKEVVLEIEGLYHDFCLYEGIIDGILARATSIATNAFLVKKAANEKKVIFMADRADSFLNLENDGYAASIGGISSQVTNAHIKNHNGTIHGTVPHSLIQLFNGDLIKALKHYHYCFPDEKIVALVDFNNDVINDSLKVAKVFDKKLKAVRVDTAANVCDKYFINQKNKEYGVNITLIKALRRTLDENNYQHVKIIVSSGFNFNKITKFENEKTPVDIYGVGASLLNIKNFFTCDSVKLNGKYLAKFGRTYYQSDRLKKVI